VSLSTLSEIHEARSEFERGVMTIDQVDQSTFAREWSEWHQAHEKHLGDPHGFLAVTGLHWLTEEPARFDDAPGEWWTSESGVRVLLADDESLEVNGETVRGEYNFGVIEERASLTARFDNAVVEVAKRGGHDIVRPRHPEHDLVRNFTGTPTFEPDPAWAVPGRFVSFRAPRAVTVGAAVEGLQHVYDAPGQIEFELGGTTHRLTVFGGSTPDSFVILFNDTTSGVTTYGANRALAVDAPDEEGRVTLDFNRATNLPCAYTDLATCPLPPAENRLPIAVEAGEKIPYERLRP
jgi:uncharacterized protein